MASSICCLSPRSTLTSDTCPFAAADALAARSIAGPPSVFACLRCSRSCSSAASSALRLAVFSVAAFCEIFASSRAFFFSWANLHASS